MREALKLADEAGLDLIEISPNANPPVCKILDLGKYRYEQQKKKAEARKNQKVVEIKEIKLSPNIDTHDYEVKLRSAQRFISEGNKVKFTLRFRGREMAYMEQGEEIMARVVEDSDLYAKSNSLPSWKESRLQWSSCRNSLLYIEKAPRCRGVFYK